MADRPLITIEHLEKSIESLETRNAFQDDIIEQLNKELSIHQEEIFELKQQLKLIANRIKDAQSTNAGKEEIEPPPPHY